MNFGKLDSVIFEELEDPELRKKYMDACVEDLIEFIHDLCLTYDESLHIFDEARKNIVMYAD
jgi:hypothetical protein